MQLYGTTASPFVRKGRLPVRAAWRDRPSIVATPPHA
jgi:hypothetical protein